MRKALLTLSLLLIAAPSWAAWDITATEVRWQAVVSDAEAAEARDAILWERLERPLVGVIATAALPQMSVTSVGGGQSRLRITMARAHAEAWVASFAALACPGAATPQAALDCADQEIRRALRALVRRYRHQSAPPIPEPPEY